MASGGWGSSDYARPALTSPMEWAWPFDWRWTALEAREAGYIGIRARHKITHFQASPAGSVDAAEAGAVSLIAHWARNAMARGRWSMEGRATGAYIAYSEVKL